MSNDPMNRELWDKFVRQIDAQVEGNFLELADEFERVTGHTFKLRDNDNVLFSMLEQAMMTQHRSLLSLTVRFISTLPRQMQTDFRRYEQKKAFKVDNNKSYRRKSRWASGGDSMTFGYDGYYA